MLLPDRPSRETPLRRRSCDAEAWLVSAANPSASVREHRAICGPVRINAAIPPMARSNSSASPAADAPDRVRVIHQNLHCSQRASVRYHRTARIRSLDPSSCCSTKPSTDRRIFDTWTPVPICRGVRFPEVVR